jgi:hypothetical protein
MSIMERPANPFGDQPQTESIDLRKAECPCCQGALKKIPSSKTKCPHCGEFMFVRTHPQDRSKVLVSAEEAARIAEDWEVIRDVREPDFRFLVTGEQVDAERDRLRRELGITDLTDDEVKWALLEKMPAVYSAEGNWGLARNSYLLMADFLLRRWKLNDALNLYFRVCAMDLNGAENRGRLSQELPKEFPPFDLRSASLAPYVVERVRVIARKMKLSMDDVRTLFANTGSTEVYPVPPEKSAEVLVLALENKIDLNNQPNCFVQIRVLLA